MSLHQRPASKVVELVQDLEGLSHTAISRLPEGVVLPSQVQYAVMYGDGDNPTEATGRDVFGKPFTFSGSEENLPADAANAELFVIPQKISIGLNSGIESVLERLTCKAKSGAELIIAAPNATDGHGSLVVKGFEVISSADAGSERLALYRHTGSNESLTNGVHKEEISILEPSTLSLEAQSLSSKLRTICEDQGYLVTIHTSMTNIDTTASKTWISMLELEQPMLQSLSESDFLNMQKLILNAERLIWLTCGDNPSFGVVDGLSRCVNNEVATAKFQVLHLSSEGMIHGPALTSRLLKSSDKTADNEFRERDGLLQVQRIYQSMEENNHIRAHLEDSTRPLSLKDDEGSFDLAIGKPGLLDSLHFVRVEAAMLAPLGDEELELQVKATGLNFRDIMGAVGVIPTSGFGQEASGVVLRAGSQAALSFKPGDRVSTLSAGGLFSTKIRCDSRVTAKMSEEMPFEEAAAAPMVSKPAPNHLILFHCHFQLGTIFRFHHSLTPAENGICCSEYLVLTVRL